MRRAHRRGREARRPIVVRRFSNQVSCNYISQLRSLRTYTGKCYAVSLQIYRIEAVLIDLAVKRFTTEILL
jgi:hypothetical protein